MTAATRRMRRANLRRVADNMSATFGCTCDSTDVKIRGAGWIEIRHDDGCSAIVGRILTVIPKQSRCGR